MVDRFNYIVRADGGVPIGQKRVGFIDEARLLVGEPAAFNAIGVVCEQDLCLVIQPSLAVGVFFLQKLCQQVHTHAPPLLDYCIPCRVGGQGKTNPNIVSKNVIKAAAAIIAITVWVNTPLLSPQSLR